MSNNFINKLSEKNIITCLIVLYLVSRLTNLNLLPIFNDEAIYLDWGFREINTKESLFYSLYDAKQPFLMWIFGIFQNIFSNPLFAGRIVSVLTGLSTAVGIYLLAEKIFSKKVAILSSTLYVIMPIFVFYDRQALMESSISAVGVWSFYFFYRMLGSKKSKYAILLGTTLGIGYFIKSNAFVFPLTILIMSSFLIFKQKQKEASKIINNLFLTFIIALLILSPLLLQSVFWSAFGQNEKYIFTISELFSFPIKPWLKNLTDVTQMIVVYINPIVVGAALYSSYLLVKRKLSDAILLISWLILGIGISIIMGRSVDLRHIVSFLPLFVILAAYYFSNVLKNVPRLLFLLAIIPSIVLTILLITSPLKYFDVLNKFTKHSQKNFYVSHWSSGYGVNETVEFLKTEINNKQAVVGVRLDAGIPENAIFAYFNRSKQIKPIYFDSQILNPEIFNYDCFTTSVPLYFVSRDVHMAGLENYFEEVARFGKPEGEQYIGIHKLKKCVGESLQIF